MRAAIHRTSAGGGLGLALLLAGCASPAAPPELTTIVPPPIEIVVEEDAPPITYAQSAILIVVDGLRADAVGPTTTPALELIASEGVSFPSESAGARTLTSVAGLLTGVPSDVFDLGDEGQRGLPIGAWTLVAHPVVEELERRGWSCRARTAPVGFHR